MGRKRKKTIAPYTRRPSRISNRENGRVREALRGCIRHPNPSAKRCPKSVQVFSRGDFCSLQSGIYRVGPLARLNICSRIGTPSSDRELKEFRD